MRINLYRPNGNNGVQLVLTEDALDAHRLLESYLNKHGDDTQDDTVRGLQLRIGYGTFTFTSAKALLLPGGADRHYGAYELLDYLAEICKVSNVGDCVSVPFSNGRLDEHATDFRNGYGVKPGLFQQFVAEAREAFDRTSDAEILIEDNG